MSANAAAEAIFRGESGRILASLVRISGSLDLAEEAMQDAFAAALEHWPQRGVPLNPGAWLTSVAHRKIIDRVRRGQTEASAAAGHSSLLAPDAPLPYEALLDEYPDDRLRLLFTCCHPALALDAQVALTLRTLGGLTTPEIARAFLLPETTLAQRLVRAKTKIRREKIPYEIPPPSALDARVAAVTAVLYLIFNEGYSATSAAALVRADLCAEAIRLARCLMQLLPDQPEAQGLLALMLLHHARHRARTGAAGELITLDDQDRSLWDRAMIDEGLALLERTLRQRQPGPYQLQAAVAALHVGAPNAEATDWKQIAALYRELGRMTPSPVISLNHAVAVAMADGPQAGLDLLAQLAEPLDQYHLYHAARGDFLRRLNQTEAARAAYEQAVRLTQNPAEKAFLRRRAAALASVRPFPSKMDHGTIYS
ncbi:MAG TPA: RNA polymerase sigma factor [Terriglobales bacterium]|nr:RNA polymerase sigma factor [Terriglobales bacterium]